MYKEIKHCLIPNQSNPAYLNTFVESFEKSLKTASRKVRVTLTVSLTRSLKG
jgi:hypothetical protein